MTLSRAAPLTELPGVGPAKARSLARLGLNRVGDLLNHFPQRYEDRRQCYAIAGAPLEQPCCVSALVAETPRLSRIRKGLELVKVKTVDHTGVLNLTFFNQSYIRDALRPGTTYVFYGQVEQHGRARSMVNPVFEKEGAGRFTGIIMPVYPLTAGISNNLLAGLTRQAVTQCLDGLPDVLPEPVRLAHQLCQSQYAYQNIHYPDSFRSLTIARRRLVFEELFVLTCGMALLRQRRRRGAGLALPGQPEAFLSLLPFSPTGAQRRAMADIAADLTSGQCMDRLIQGDVGSGKTAVAAFAAWAAARNGRQCALMAPTELLAEQHCKTLRGMLSPAGVRVGLLTGSVKGAEKKRLLAALAAGEIDLMVGTHALFSEGVGYPRLSLVITDEQHRFGVAQRAALAAKGSPQTQPGGEGPPGAAAQGPPEPPPHVLVMSATPIPRTLALIIYGDLDVSIIDELPPGRTPVATYMVGEDKRQRMYGFIRKQVSLGRQAYIVCPAVDEGEAPPEWNEPTGPLELKAATAHAKELRETVFPDLRIGLVHGKMKPKDKEAAMAAFSAGELDVLVSTTVIEVGVDVPNASLMIVENAERFGLSQLHQLRGRVGRGTHQSFCILMTSTKSGSARERLRALCADNDGFRIAEEDLRLRGPGDFFGRRQHGLPQLKVADFAADVALLKEAKLAAEEAVSQDPELKSQACRPLRRRIEEMFQETPERFN